MAKIDYENKPKKKAPRKPNQRKKLPVPGSGRNRPAFGYDPVAKTWEKQEK